MTKVIGTLQQTTAKGLPLFFWGAGWEGGHNFDGKKNSFVWPLNAFKSRIPVSNIISLHV